jgi:hypothetical protein
VLLVSQQRLDQLPALIVALVSGVANSHNKTINAPFAPSFMLFYRHRYLYGRSAQKYNSRSG